MTEGSHITRHRPLVGRESVVTIIVALGLFVLESAHALAQFTFSLSYSARLTNSSGAPLTGPVGVKATFWDAGTGGQQLGPMLSFDSVVLNNGALALDLALTSAHVSEVFGDGSHPVYIEITAGDKTYPRQMYSFVPLALRVPVDDKNLKFNDSGKLTLAVGAKPNTNSFLTQDSSGNLTWASPATSQLSISDQDIAAGAGISQSKIAGLSAALAAKEDSITAGTASQYFRGDKTWHALSTASVTEGGTNLYYTDARARSALTGAGPISYSIVSGTIGISQAGGTASGYLSSSDWAAFNNKQNALGYAPVNKAGDTMTGALDMNTGEIKNAGNVGMAPAKTLLLSNNSSDPTGLTAADKGKTWFNSATNEVKYWDGTSAKALGVAGSGLANLNGVTTTTQSFATPGTSGTAPTWSSSGSSHTLNIPLASASGVTAGLVSNSDYVAFGAKVGAVMGASGISVATSSGTATVTLANTPVTAGTYARANITVDAQGRLTAAQSAAAIVDADISNVAAVAQSKIAGLSASLAAKEDAVTAGTSSQYYRGDKTWQSLNSTAVAEGSNLYYTDARAKAALTSTAPITYSTTTGAIGITQANGSADGYLASSDWATFSNKISSVTAGTGLTGGGSSGAVTINVDVGTTANKLVRLDANAKLPAVDGSALTNLTADNLIAPVPISKGGTGASSTSANYIFAGPTGASGAPAFRALVASDYPAMVGSNGTAAGTRGAVPAPAASDYLKFLRGDGSWQTPPAAGATNQIQYNSGGNLAADASFVFAGGNVGIGTTAPGNKLEVSGNAAVTGSVAIGTTTPNYNLTVASNGGWATSLGLVNSSGTGHTYSLESTGSSHPYGPGKLLIYDSTGGPRMVIDGAGNVGFGTTSPGAKLDIGGQIIVGNDFGWTSGGLRFRDTSGTIDAAIVQGNSGQLLFRAPSGANGSNGFSFVNGSTSSTLVTITNTGNVGMGTNSPTSTLQVNGSIATATNVKSSDYTLTGLDSVIIASAGATGPGFTLTLPTAVGIAGREYTIIRNDANTNYAVTVATTSSQKIGLGSSFVLRSIGQLLKVVSDGANWQTLAPTRGSVLQTVAYSNASVYSTTAFNTLTNGGHTSYLSLKPMSDASTIVVQCTFQASTSGYGTSGFYQIYDVTNATVIGSGHHVYSAITPNGGGTWYEAYHNTSCGLLASVSNSGTSQRQFDVRFLNWKSSSGISSQICYATEYFQ